MTDSERPLISELSKVEIKNNDDSFNNFSEICRGVLDSFAPIEKKYIRGNHSPIMNKIVGKIITKRTKLRNKFLKSRSEEDRKKYTDQRNFCVSLLRKTKRDYYKNLSVKNVTDNGIFWKTIKPMLSNKSVSNEKIILVENQKILSNDNDIAKVLNDFFSNIVKTRRHPAR